MAQQPVNFQVPLNIVTPQAIQFIPTLKLTSMNGKQQNPFEYQVRQLESSQGFAK